MHVALGPAIEVDIDGDWQTHGAVESVLLLRIRHNQKRPTENLLKEGVTDLGPVRQIPKSIRDSANSPHLLKDGSSSGSQHLETRGNRRHRFLIALAPHPVSTLPAGRRQRPPET